MIEILKNSYVLGGIIFIVFLIIIAFRVGAGSGGKYIFQPGTSKLMRNTSLYIKNIIPKK